MELKVYFDGQYWTGLVEYTDSENCLRVFRHVFGAEPSEQDIYRFIEEVVPLRLDEPWHSQIKNKKASERRINPKRMQRLIQKEKKKPIVTTKAQAAITEQYEALKVEKKKKRRKRKFDEKQFIFEKKQQKRMEKRKGH